MFFIEKTFRFILFIFLALEADVILHKCISLLDKLPEANYNLLKYFVEFLTKVSKHAGANRMGPRNLALVFGASLLNPPSDVQYDLTNIKYQCDVIEKMITNYGYVFEGNEGEQPTTRLEKQVATIPAGAPKPPTRKKNRNFFDRPQFSGSSRNSLTLETVRPNVVPNSMSMSSNAVLATKKIKKDKPKKKKKKGKKDKDPLTP